ncbi:hypothetical protein D9599_08900 [Roseomonas sp. KE2513]|uniref:hypothetical protein n=1 Tax=Roseomonas sp. KE2513 TaxID=2479202 RepID=UPI0018E05206|nr:hypothetical protein [Roseomonas sp. KE2513]MBI0535690.1 hypothetical protein [Roseomonas sp. KE2513]
MSRRVLALLLFAATPVAAQDEPIELADDPFEITDPIAAAPGTAEIGVVGAYERARQGRIRDTGALQTEYEIGVLPRLELRLGQTGAYGNLETRRRLGTAVDLTDGDTLPQQQEERERARAGGTSGLGLLYQLSEERGAAPAVGLLGRIRTIYGPGRTAYEAEGVALVGKTFRPGRLPLGIHANFGWTTRIDPQPGDRTNRYLFNASIGQAVTSDLALVLTYALSQQERGNRDFSLLQAGLRYRLPNGAVVGVAGGAGLNRDTPALQISVAVQFALGN